MWLSDSMDWVAGSVTSNMNLINQINDRSRLSARIDSQNMHEALTAVTNARDINSIIDSVRRFFPVFIPLCIIRCV